MAAGRKRRGGGGGGHDGPDERWLLTYADMITLLMALFIVMFSISSVNTSKLEVLQKSLKEAFSGRVLPGGENVLQAGGTPTGKEAPKAEPPVPAIQPLIRKEFQKEQEKKQSSKQGTEDEQFKQVKRNLDQYAAQHGLKNKLETEITRRGLVIRLLTDGVLFDSGQAKIKPGAMPVLEKIAGLLQVDQEHPINVEGHTDNVPI
jgi:chemotaxis protein MotB